MLNKIIHLSNYETGRNSKFKTKIRMMQFTKTLEYAKSHPSRFQQQTFDGF